MMTMTNNVPSEPALSGLSPMTSFTGSVGEVHLRRPEEVAPFLDHLAAVLSALNYSPRDSLGVRLSLEEAIVNGLSHGNGGDATKSVRVRYHVTSDDVLAEVEDEGPGFDPERVADPARPENLERLRGRGLLLMRHYMTWVRFLGRGNRVVLYKRAASESASK
jgi:serine/threonine-protein kinase RsbW